ncbi:MAG TPA: alpha/beta hydrolase [Ilumatobacter sp.]|nr:alpha/beta hydrolase [Ilumatobacter sp.]
MLRRVVVIVAGALSVAACSSSGNDATAISAATPVATDAANSTPSSAPAPELATEPAPPTGSTAPDTQPPVPPFEPQPIEWTQFNDAVDVGTLAVPIDYADPAGQIFQLHLARYNALDQENKIGTLLVNPGGPGFGGSVLAVRAADIYDRALRERFDIIGWDPRGTGQSTPPIDCVDDYDEYFAGDETPQNDAERAQVVDTDKRFAEGCQARSGDILHHVGTNDSARDIDVIRRAVGEQQISYFGFSYGSELGAAWATLFPDTVRAMVLDGAADPDADPVQSNLEQLRGFEAALNTFLAQCSEDESCAFNNRGDAGGAFDTLMAQLDATPIASAPDRPPLNRAMATVAVVQAMYRQSFWPALAQSLAAAQAGDGAGLLQFFDMYYQRSQDGTWGNQLEAFRVIDCMDQSLRQTVEELDAQTPAFHEAAPRLVPADSAAGYVCGFLPPSSDPRVDVTAAGAGPVMVIGTTGDPATPFDSTRSMAEQLQDARLVVVTANQHTGYGVNDCVIDVVNAYLIDLEPPDGDTTCS